MSAVRTQSGHFTVAQATITRDDEGKPVTLTTRKGRSVTTTLNDSEAIARLQDVSGDFASSLREQNEKSGLSREQWIWVHLLVVEAGQKDERDEQVAGISLSETVGYIESASATLKYPKVRLETEDGRKVVLSRAGDRAKLPGSINITDGGPFGENVWYGRILTDGTLMPSRSCDDLVLNLLQEFNENPAEVASAYGIRTGNCCFCRKELSTKESLTVGYGPICAEKWSLPWGHVEETVCNHEHAAV